MVAPLLNSDFNIPYYEGSGSSTVVPHILDVALGGHPYRIDWSADSALRHVSVPILRQQQDNSARPGEQSINPEGLWRRTGEGWHFGAGQTRYDRRESHPFRFRASEGIDIWEPWELRLLPRTEELYDSSAAVQFLAVTDIYLHFLQGTTHKWVTTLGGAATTVTGGPGVTATGIATNGYYTWTAWGTSGIYRSSPASTVENVKITGTVGTIAFVKNRLMVAGGVNIYDATSLGIAGGSAALPTPLFTHNNLDWTWVGFAESQNFIYAAGYAGDKSLIYSTSVKPDGTALDVPAVAGALPDGEIVASVYGYLGRFLVIGSNKGFRLALVGNDGGLTIGALIQTSLPVLAFEGQEEFIWFGWGEYSGTSTGLGRMSTATFSDVESLTPAYASDLMMTGDGNVTSVVTFENRRVFAVAEDGIYAEHATELVASGSIESGTLSYGLAELKTALFVDLQVLTGGATTSSIEIQMATDGGSYESIGTINPLSNSALLANERTGYEYEIKAIISRDGADATLGPALLSWLFRVQPRPVLTNIIYATILLAPIVQTKAETPYHYNTVFELAFLESLNGTKKVTTWQENTRSYSVVLEDYEMNVHHLIDDESGQTGFNASCTLKLKRI